MVRKRMLLSGVVVAMFCSASFALVPMGPPVAGLEQGKYSFGVGFAQSDMNVEVSGPLTGGAGGEKVINDLQTDMYWVSLGYGISDDWEIFGGIGWANAEFPGDGPAVDFDGDDGFAFGIGTKRTLAQDGDTKWGVLGQYTQGKSEDNTRSSSGTTWGNGSISLGINNQTKLELYEVQLALGPAVPLSEDVTLYGGPFLHFLEGDLEIKGSRDEYDLEQKLQLGAYIGALVSLGDPNASLMAEFLYTGEAWAWGIGALIRCP